MNLPCKELKRIARDNLNGNYKIPMGAFLAATPVSYTHLTLPTNREV